VTHRRNEFDVENRVNTTDPDAVSREVCDIYCDVYQTDGPRYIVQAFHDVALLYRGRNPGYYGCETAYHDIQHVLDVTLAMARVMSGVMRARNEGLLTERLFRFGVLAALCHDVGYIRHRKDTRHATGAEYTKTHVSRGGRFLEEYLETIGMGDLAHAATRTLHFTGYEVPIGKIRLDPEYRLIGNLLGTADILAQMADRCYLEKCYDRLYPEFVSGGVARQMGEDGRERVIYESAADVVYRTPQFYESAQKRLKIDLGGYCDDIEKHFGGENPYMAEVGKNVEHARRIADAADISLLRRKPPRIAAAEDDRLI
jgi:hypothetical protein